MLEGDGQEPLPGDADFLLFFIEPHDLYPSRPFDLGREIDDAQASLFPEQLPLGAADLGIDEF